MNISLIAAMAKNRVIGHNNTMPWHMPADLKRFKAITTGKPIIMGRKTFESIGKPLPHRQNIILSRQTEDTLSFDTTGCTLQPSLQHALDTLKNEAEVIIIGGANVYKQALPRAHRLYLTFIDADIDGDTFFPEWNPSQWIEVDRIAHPADANNPHACTFVEYTRR